MYRARGNWSAHHMGRTEKGVKSLYATIIFEKPASKVRGIDLLKRTDAYQIMKNLALYSMS